MESFLWIPEFQKQEWFFHHSDVEFWSKKRILLNSESTASERLVNSGNQWTSWSSFDTSRYVSQSIQNPFRCFRNHFLSTVGAADSTVVVVRSSQSRGKPSRVAITGRRYIWAHAGCSSNLIDPLCTHGFTISNITGFEQAIFVLLLKAYTPSVGYWEPIAEPLLWWLEPYPPGLFIPSDNSSWNQAWSRLELSLGINSPGG